jgi:hypothetical protein
VLALALAVPSFQERCISLLYDDKVSHVVQQQLLTAFSTFIDTPERALELLGSNRGENAWRNAEEEREKRSSKEVTKGLQWGSITASDWNVLGTLLDHATKPEHLTSLPACMILEELQMAMALYRCPRALSFYLIEFLNVTQRVCSAHAEDDAASLDTPGGQSMEIGSGGMRDTPPPQPSNAISCSSLVYLRKLLPSLLAALRSSEPSRLSPGVLSRIFEMAKTLMPVAIRIAIDEDGRFIRQAFEQCVYTLAAMLRVVKLCCPSGLYASFKPYWVLFASGFEDRPARRNSREECPRLVWAMLQQNAFKNLKSIEMIRQCSQARQALKSEVREFAEGYADAIVAVWRALLHQFGRSCPTQDDLKRSHDDNAEWEFTRWEFRYGKAPFGNDFDMFKVALHRVGEWMRWLKAFAH